MARKSSPLSAPLAVCSVCLSDPEQADVPPKALWVAIATSTSRRFSSTAARSPAAPLPRTRAPQRRTGSLKPSAETNSCGGLSLASLGIAMSVNPSRIAWGIGALTIFFRVLAVDGMPKIG